MSAARAASEGRRLGARDQEVELRTPRLLIRGLGFPGRRSEEIIRRRPLAPGPAANPAAELPQVARSGVPRSGVPARGVPTAGDLDGAPGIAAGDLPAVLVEDPESAEEELPRGVGAVPPGVEEQQHLVARLEARHPGDRQTEAVRTHPAGEADHHGAVRDRPLEPTLDRHPVVGGRPFGGRRLGRQHPSFDDHRRAVGELAVVHRHVERGPGGAGGERQEEGGESGGTSHGQAAYHILPRTARALSAALSRRSVRDWERC